MGTVLDAVEGIDRRGAARRAPAPQVAALIASHVGQPEEQIRRAVPYLDRAARVDGGDVLHQIAWFKSQGMLKDNVNGDAIVDKRYVVPLPKR